MKLHKIIDKITSRWKAPADGVRHKWAQKCLTLLALSLIATAIAIAATANWPFSAASEAELYDGERIEVAGGVLRLKAQKPWHRHDSKTEFDAGTYSDTEYLQTTNLPNTASSVSLATSGLVAYYPLNGTTGAISNGATAGLEDTKSTNEGTASTNGGMAFAAGRFGNGVSFDSGDSINLPESSTFSPGSSDFTISIWALTTTTAGGSNRIYVNTGATATIYVQQNGGGSFLLQITDDTGTTKTSTPSGFSINQWFHMSAVKNGTTVQFYIDGVLRGTLTGVGNLTLTGGTAPSIGLNWQGSVDDFSYYNRALTKDEVEALAAAGAAVHMKSQTTISKHSPKLSGGEPGLVAYYSMDHSSGTTAADLVGKNKGTLTSFPASPWVTGVNGNALHVDSVDSNDYVTLGSGIIKKHGPFTMSAWVYSPTFTRQPASQPLIWAKTSGAATAYMFRLSDEVAGELAFSISGTTSGSVSGRSGAADVAATNQWNHIALTYSGSGTLAGVKGYLNGTDIGGWGAPIDNLVGLPDPDTWFIAGDGTSNIQMDIKIDEVAIFNRALSANEIAYLAGLKGETATYTSPAMDGEIAGVTWDKMRAEVAKVTPGMQFAQVSFGGTITAHRATTVADMDGDGDMDAVVGSVNGGAGLTGWLENDGSGSFTYAAISNTDEAMDIAVGDLTGDKANDVVAADNVNGGIEWYLNDGLADPAFTKQTQITADGSPQTVALGDIDNDGDLDVVAGFGGAVDKIVWYQSDGAATPAFTAQTAVVTGWDAYHLIVADLNADGFLDIAAASNADNKITWFKGDGGSSWTATDVVTAGFLGAQYIDAADIDSDGDLDLAAASNGSSKITWFVNDGSATPAFATANNVSTTYTGAKTVRGIDFDNDGDMDLVTTGTNVTDWWENNGSQSFTKKVISTAHGPSDSDIADLTGDGAHDIASNTSGSTSLTTYLNTPWKVSISGSAGWETSMIAGDLDGDGDLDTLSSALYPSYNNGSGSLSAGSQIDAALSGSRLGLGDFDGDGDLDIVAYKDTSNFAWYANDGSWTKTAITAANTGAFNQRKIVTGDLDGDGDIDFVMGGNSCCGGAYLSWWRNDDGAATFTEMNIGTAVAFAASHWSVIDMEGDGDLDIVTSAGGSGDIVWYSNDGAGSFTANSIITSGAGELGAAAADLDGDGDVDVVGVVSGNLTWYSNNGSEAFTPVTIAALSTANYQDDLFIRDVDGNGALDIVHLDHSGPPAIFYNDGSENFSRRLAADVNCGASPAVTYHAGAVGDFNGDGLIDLAMAHNNGVCLASQQPYALALLQTDIGAGNPPSGTFIGPDGTAATFIGAAKASDAITAASDAFAGVPGTNARYLRWKATLYRNSTTLDPILKNVRLDYTALPYSTLNPYAVSAAGQAFTYLTSFTATSETEPATSDIRYQLSKDGGVTWKYYNSGWVASNGTFAQSTDSSVINTNIATFDDTLTANGTLKWKALMSSDGSAQPSVAALDIGYEIASVALVVPDAANTVMNQSTIEGITWTPTGVVPNDLVLEYDTAGAGSVFGSPGNIATGLNSNNHNEENAPASVGVLGVWHLDGALGSIANAATAGLEDAKSTNEGTANNTDGLGMAFVAGKFGNGVDFDGVDDAVSAGDVLDFSQTDSFSISVWFNADTSGTNAIVAKKRGGQSGYSMKIGSGKLRALLESGSSVNLGSGTSVSTGVWTHGTMVVDRSAQLVKIYMNGTPEGQADISSVGTLATSYPFYVGSEYASGSPFTYDMFDGKIDEVAVFNRALTQSEIDLLASSSPGFLWDVPVLNTNQGRVRIRSAGAPAIRDTSANNFADGVYWVGGTGLNWSTGANWSTGTPPAAGDVAIFNATSDAVVGDVINDNLGGIALISGFAGTVTIKKNSVAGGMVLNVTGDVTVTVGELILEADADGTPANGQGFSINANDITVGPLGKIHADGKGFGANGGPGAGIATSNAGTGASHGGVGGLNLLSGAALPASTYGSAASPTSVGSGGRTVAGPGNGGPGGGAIKLAASGTVTVNGTLSALGSNGTFGGGGSGSGGAGGSLWIASGTLAGTGTISASGGNGTGSAGGGGGGRIDISGVTNTFTGNLLVNGGTPTTSYGYAGTIVFPPNYDLTLATDASGLKDFTLGYDGTYDYVFNSITVKSGATLKISGNPVMVNGGSASNPYGKAPKITAATLAVETGGKITADGSGFSTEKGPGGSTTDSGASYGGLGGVGTPAAVYGAAFQPLSFGSGGNTNGGGGTGGAGGGAIYLVATGTLTVDGTLSANGGNASWGGGSSGSGGSGGSIWISAGTVAGIGLISANGGNHAGGALAGGGGGGRIYITAGSTSGWSGNALTPAGAAVGGTSATTPAAQNGTVIVGKVWKAGAPGNYSTAANWTNGSLPGAGDSIIFTGTVSNQNATFDTVNVSLANMVVASDYTGTITLNQNAFSGTDTFTLTGDFLQYGGFVALNADADGNPVNGEGITISAVNITVDTGATLHANDKGFGSGAGPGNATGGAGHGGVGGATSSQTHGPTYGTAASPTSIGSDGGGGAIKLSSAGTVTVKGTVSANATGAVSVNGSGGSIWITGGGTLAGTGTVSANGAPGGCSGGGQGAGGGGRIDVSGMTISFTGTLSASESAPGNCHHGRHGTIVFPNNYDLVVANDGATGLNDLKLGYDGSYDYSFNSITIKNAAMLMLDGNPLVVNAADGGTSGNPYGRGPKITAATVTVENGGTLAARGFGGGFSAAGKGPGGTSGDTTGGGSYGGLGGGTSGAAYGRTVQPTALGSGVSASDYMAGGSVYLVVSGTTTVDGTIRATANSAVTGAEASRGFSGGSVYISTGTLAGAATGVISANGGNGRTSGGGGYSGGGGRVYIARGTNTYSGTITANAGTGGLGAGAAGTVTIAALDITAPNGAEAWRVGSNHLISWTDGATLPNDLILEYSLNDPGFSSPVSIATGVRGNGHNEEKMSGALAVYHFDQGQLLLNPIANATTNGFQDSKGANHGTASNTDGLGMAFTSSGKFGGAVDFDGTDDMITASNNAALDMAAGANMTLSAWINPDAIGGNKFIMAQGTGGAYYNYNLFLDASGNVRLGANSGGTTASNSAISTGVWTHVVLVKTGSTATYYKNGVADGTITKDNTGTNASYPFRVGGSSSAGEFFDGKIDEVAVFNRALALDEIQALASSTPGYVWNIPNEDDAMVRVRVRSAADTVLSDISTADFKITDIDITAPNAGTEIWRVGTTNHAITWTGGSLLSNDLILEYTRMAPSHVNFAASPGTLGTDPMNSWVEIDGTITTPLNATTGTPHTWSAVPDAVGPAYVRIRSAANADLYDISDNAFTITDLDITLPNGANVLYEGEKYAISWGHGGTSLADLVLEIDTGGGFGALSPPATNLSVRRGEVSSPDAGLNPASIANAVGVWRLNDGAGTSIRDSVGTNTGTLNLGAGGNTTAANAWVNGQFGKALSLDGTDDYVSLGSYNTIQTIYTIAVWAKGSGASQVVVHRGTSNGCAYHWLSLTSAGDTGSCISGVTLAANDNQWHHLAMSRSGNNMKVYADGILKFSYVGSPATANQAGTFEIGRSPWAGSYFNGLVDDLVTFNRVLTDGEIRQLAGGSYEWTVPDVPSTTTKIRVRSAAATDLTDDSDANFEIRARSLTLTSPNGSESYQEASRQVIEWTPAGLVSNNLTLDYNKGGGAYTTIATGVDAGGAMLERGIGGWGLGDGGQTLADKSGNGNNGTLGATSAVGIDDPRFVLGKFGHALEFDGVNDYVLVPDSTSLNPASVSISAWVKTSFSGAAQGILEKDRGASTSYSLYLASDGKINFDLYTSGSIGKTSAASVNDGNWHHIAAIYGTNYGVYIDGVLSGTLSGGGSAITASPASNLFLGSLAASNVPQNFFRGQIDEVQVYNRQLLTTEITKLASGKGLYPWIIPDDEHAQVKVRVTDANRPATTDDSDANFAITPRTVAMVAPNGAEVWPQSSIRYITWDATGPLSDNLTINYDPDVTGGPVFAGVVGTGVDAGGKPLAGAVGAWGLGEGAGTAIADKSGNANNGTLSLGTGGNILTVDAWKVGKLGYAIDFDGVDDYVALASEIQETGDLTVAAWVNAATFTDAYIVGSQTGAAGHYFRLNSSTQLQSRSEVDIARNFTVPAMSTGTWYHIALKRESGSFHAYLNGTESSTGAIADAGAFHVGYFGRYSANQRYRGMIDEVHVYNRALTNAEITALAQGRGLYPWTVPDVGFSSSTRHFVNSQVRITDTERAATTDDSNANFELRTPIISITGPPPPPAVPFGQPQDISWTNDWAGAPAVGGEGGPVSSDLRLEYSIDDGSSYPGGAQLIVGGSVQNGGPVTTPFTWGVPAGAVSSTVKVRVRDNAAPYAEGESATFKVTGSAAIQSPNGGEKWAAGFQHTINWLTQGSISNVTVFTHNGDGVPITTIATNIANTSSVPWTPAPADAGTGLKIRVVDANDSDVFDDTNGTFTVSTVAVTDPAARMLAGELWTINWTHTGLTNVKLEYALDGTFDGDEVTIVATTPAAAGSYNNGGALTVPLNTTINFKVRASDPDAPGVGDTDLAFDESNTAATIYGGLQVQVPSSSGINWASGQQQTITWTTSPANANVIPNIRILAAKNGNFNDTSGGNIVTITTSTPNHNVSLGNGSFNWIPNFNSTLAKVRVLDPADPDAVAGIVPQGQDIDDSNNFFTISGLSITSPVGGETAIVNGNFGITYEFTGVITNVDIHYSPDGQGAWIPIETNFNVPSNPHTYTWTNVPDDISTDVYIRVRDTSDPNNKFAISQAAMNIKGSIGVTTPGALLVSDPYTINYTTTGSIPDVIIEFSKNGQFAGDEITVGTPAGLPGDLDGEAHTFNWPGNVPDAINITGKLRITATDTANPAKYPNGTLATTTSSGVFTIGPKMTITAPLTAAEWGVSDQNRNITWTNVGTITNVKLEYFTETDGYTAPTEFQASIANNNSHNWNPIPDLVTAAGQNPQTDRDIMVKVRITDIDAGHPATSVLSDPFKIKWYRVLWKVKDADNAALLQNLSVVDNSPWNVNDFTVTQTIGVLRNYKKGTYTTTFQKQTGYSDTTTDGWSPDDLNPDVLNGADKVIETFMQNDATANIPKSVKAEYVYDAATQTLEFRWWIEVKGELETNQNILGAGRIEVLTPGSTVILQTVNDPDNEDANGMYEASWVEGGTLNPNQIYFAKAIVTHNSQEFTSGLTIDIRGTTELQNITTTLGTVSTTVTTIDGRTQTISTQLGTVDGKVDTVDTKVSALQTTIGNIGDAAGTNSLVGLMKTVESQQGDVSVIEANSADILTAVTTTLPAKIDAIEAGGGGVQKGNLLSRSTQAAQGESTELRFQYKTGTAPVADIYGPDNKIIKSNVPLKEIAGTGLFTLDINTAGYEKGDHTVLVKDGSGSLSSMVMTVTSANATQEKIAAAASSASAFSQNAAADAKRAFDGLSALRSLLGGPDEVGIGNRLTEMADMLMKLRKGMYFLTGGAELGEDGEGVTIDMIHELLMEVMGSVTNVASAEGVNLDTVYASVAQQANSQKEIQNMIAATEASVMATREMIERAKDSPVMTTWFEAAV